MISTFENKIKIIDKELNDWAAIDRSAGAEDIRDKRNNIVVMKTTYYERPAKPDKLRPQRHMQMVDPEASHDGDAREAWPWPVSQWT